MPTDSADPGAAGVPILECRDVVAGYIPGVDILKGASIAVPEGAIVSIIGPNGAGKSTLAKAVFGLVPVSSGSVYVDGEEVTGSASHQLVRRGMAYVPQRDNVFGGMSVRENLEIGGTTSRSGMVERAEELYEMFPRLAERRRQAAGTLSGGERQMVAFARALMSRPRLLLLDEPSAGLAPKVVAEVLETIRRIRAEEGVSVLLVEQNARAALAMSDRGYVLDQGVDAHSGAGPDLLADPKVAQIYLGVRTPDA